MQQLQLRARYVPGDNPKIEIFDQKGAGMLFSIRTYLQSQEKGKYQRNVIEKGPLLSIVADATGKNTQKPVVPAVNTAPASMQVQPPAPTVDVPLEEPVEEPTGRLTGPGAKTARKPAQTQMTTEVLGRERRSR